MGTWRVYHTQNKSVRRTVTLGREGDLTREEAERMLKNIIDRDVEQFEAVRFLSAATKPKQQRRIKPDVDLTAGVIGSIAEYAVAIDLMERGFHVYKAMCPQSACDLMVCDATGEFRLRIEVKSAEYRQGRVAVNVRRNAGKFDVLAILTNDGSILYRTHNGIGNPLGVSDDPSAWQAARP
jgi:hypothetical protein